MPSNNIDNNSPSASSVFLPLGRAASSNQNSALAPELDQDALSQALNNIHSAASQSQNLTVFNDYTEPPSAVTQTDGKGLASEVQGGLTGLYNKFKATVGGNKDLANSAVSHTSDRQSVDKTLSQPASGRTSRVQSRVQSPRLPPSDHSYPELPSQSSKLSSMNASISKLSISSAPAVKSPVAPSQPSLHIADAAVSEITIHSTNNPRQHSRQASSIHTDENARHDRLSAVPAEEHSLRKVLSRNENEPKMTWQDRRVASPQLATAIADNRHSVGSHERGLSEHSISSHLSRTNHVLKPTSPLNARDEGILERVLTHRREESNDLKPGFKPLQLTPDHPSLPLTTSRTLEIPKPIEQPLSPLSPLAVRPTAKLLPRVSQSRLPGFPASRASSTDSGLTRIATGDLRKSLSITADTITDGAKYQYYPKPPTKLRSKLLSREFWMRDENARDCFRCGEPFTTFRRKHHCRTCGQIFDNKCTTVISGAFFGAQSGVRVCKPCEVIITSHDEDSSDYSADDAPPIEAAPLPRTPDMSLALPRLDDDNISVMSTSLDHVAKTPTMNLPVRRALDSSNRSSAVLEFDTIDRPLPRPSSSRSLRTSHSISHGHRRHHSRHQHIRNAKTYHEERAPFEQKRAGEDLQDTKNSAFHRDSIIDPDLAQYLSDDASSADEHSVQEDSQQDKLSRSGPDSDRLTIGGLIAAVRKGRSRIGDRSIAGFLNIGKDNDDAASITSSRAIDRPQLNRIRNLSVASSVHHRLTPRATKERLHVVIPDEYDADYMKSPASIHPRSRMIRSASMHGSRAPSLELNRASMQHVQKLLKQLLKDADIPKATSWEEALVPILLRATDDVDPDVQDGDDIDIRNYVKLKKVPGGRPNDTSYFSGLVFTKNIALKSMSRSIMNPSILIITFALEYARHEQHFMSLDPVIRQEREYLENVVGRIAALKPDVLLAQRNISGLALELLEKAKITTVYNVKSSVLEAVSRCTQTRVANSMDKLGLSPDQLGTCDSFEVKTFVAEGRRKTYIYLSGCAPHLGCSIVLRGADRKILGKIKRITDFMVYVVYNLKLETCLMRDEWALIPTLPDDHNANKSGVSGNLKVRSATPDPSPETGDGIKEIQRESTDGLVHPETNSTEAKDGEKQSQQGPQLDEESTEIPDDIPVPMFYEDLVEKHQTKIVSASPFVKFAPPYLLMRARELERRVAYLKQLRDQDMSSSETSTEEKGKAQKFILVQPEMVHAPLAGASRKVREIIHAVHDAEYDKALHNYETQKKQWEAYISGNRNLFDPYAHQNIVVLFSQVSTATSVPCSGPDLLAFSFYNEHESEEEFEADCTLGQFVEDLCYRANDTCSSEVCEKKLFEHHRQYVHGEAQVTVFLQPYPAKMRGLQDVILMWSQCKICGVETTVTPMSQSTWKYSFGKYLELSFWSADLHARAGVCPHDLHRDHLRFFGYKDFALRVHYDPIGLLELVVPRMRITWKVDNDLRFRNELFTKVELRIFKFMISVKLRLKSINIDAVLPDTADACRTEIESLTKRANEDHTMLIKQLQERYSNSQHWEIIPLNRTIRLTQEKVADWDIAFADFERNYFPSEKDIRRLATLQLKKIFLDRDVSVTTPSSGDDGSVTPTAGEHGGEKDAENSSKGLSKSQIMSPEKAQNVLQSVLEEHGSAEAKVPSDSEKKALAEEIRRDQGLALPEVPGGHHNTEDVEHLDLAIPQPEPQVTAITLGPGPQPDNPTLLSKDAATSGSAQEGPLTSTDIDDLAGVITNSSEEANSTLPRSVPMLTRDLLPVTFRQATPGGSTSPILLRAQSQPSGSVMLRKDVQIASTSSAINATNGFGSTTGKAIPVSTNRGHVHQELEDDKSDHSRFSTLKKFAKSQSFIPRAITTRKDSRVSNLAKHFEQLSREFERERIRERKLRAARSRQSRVYPISVSKPIVEVYKDVDEAVDEDEPSRTMFDHKDDVTHESGATAEPAQGTAETDPDQTTGDGSHAEEYAEEAPAETTENDTEVQHSSHAPSETEDRSSDDESEDIYLPDSPEDLLRLSQEDLDMKELPKHERTSLMKMLTNFWAERSSSGWSPLEYPLSASDHIFADCDIIVREDEPSSIIAFALYSSDYRSMLHDIQDHPGPQVDPDNNNIGIEKPQMQTDVMHSLLRKTGTHLRYQFEEGPAKMLCKVFFAEQFDAMRRKCGVADRFVESMSRCLKWDSKGGKTKSLFLKTLDDRFVLKSLSRVETQSFLKFAPNYFQIMSEAFFHDLPSVIAKMLGFYQVVITNPVTGVEYNWFLLVMENLFYDRVPTRIFDLKGSMRNRKINATGERNEVLLDENMVEFIYESPLFAREHSKKLLRSSVHNDTLFLARQNVMDYSLMIAIDEVRKELVVGIIDCIRTYTWDKKLETWIKDRGFPGGSKNRPTVTSPKEYKRRFREAMNRYVLEAPSCWYHFKPVKGGRLLKADGEGDKGENELQTLT